MRKILEECPSCGGALEVTRLNCTSCQTIILGQWRPCTFCTLSPESSRFLLTFVQCRGNVKEMERELGISYWTVRRQVDELIAELGIEAAPAEEVDTTAQELEILEQVNEGQISPDEALEALAQLKRSRI
jgi:hypothetical protein